jgi:hypothetical protein
MHRFIPIFNVLLSSLFSHTALGQLSLLAFAYDNCTPGADGEIVAHITASDIEMTSGCVAPGPFRSVDFRSGSNALCTLYTDISCQVYITTLRDQGCMPVPGQSIMCFKRASEDLPLPPTDLPDRPTKVTSSLPDISVNIPPPSNSPQIPTSVNPWADMTADIIRGPAQLAVINPLTPKGGGLVQLALPIACTNTECDFFNKFRAEYVQLDGSICEQSVALLGRFNGADQRAYLSDLLTAILDSTTGSDIPAKSEHVKAVLGNAAVEIVEANGSRFPEAPFMAIAIDVRCGDIIPRIEYTCYTGNVIHPAILEDIKARNSLASTKNVVYRCSRDCCS